MYFLQVFLFADFMLIMFRKILHYGNIRPATECCSIIIWFLFLFHILCKLQQTLIYFFARHIHVQRFNWISFKIKLQIIICNLIWWNLFSRLEGISENRSKLLFLKLPKIPTIDRCLYTDVIFISILIAQYYRPGYLQYTTIKI